MHPRRSTTSLPAFRGRRRPPVSRRPARGAVGTLVTAAVALAMVAAGCSRPTPEEVAGDTGTQQQSGTAAPDSGSGSGGASGSTAAGEATGSASAGGHGQEATGLLASADETADAGGELTVRLDYDTAEDGGLDPQAATAARSWMIEGLVYQTLVTVDQDMQVQPGLATSWETPDDTTYVFTITDDAVFSNGRAMTADDVTGSLQRLLDTPTVWTGQLGPVTSVKTTGDHEVTVKLSQPYTPFLAALANTPAAVLPMKEIKAGSIDITEKMVGTGPLRAVEHRQDEYWEFEPNKHNPVAGVLGFDSLRIDIVTDETTRAAGLRDGSTDLAVFNSVDTADLVSGTANAKVVTQQNTDFHYLMINAKSSTKALADQKVRFAINSAIDREAINDLVFAGETAATGVTPSPLPESCSAQDLPSASGDIAAAKKVIDDVGGLQLNLLVYTSEPVLAQIAQVIQQNLQQIGVTVQIEQLDYASYSDRVYADPADFDLALSWFAGYADPAMVTTWWNPEIAGFSQVFMNGTDEINSLIADGGSTAAGERGNIFASLCEKVDADSEMIPLVLRPTILGYNSDTLSPSLYAVEGYGNFLRLVTEFRAAK